MVATSRTRGRVPKLKTLKPMVSTIKPLIGWAPGDEKAKEKYRRDNQPSKRWLKTTWWQETRKRVLRRDLYRCQWPGCGVLVAGKGQAHVDHIDPHNEDRAKFFCEDRGLQVLCEHCHNSKKQREEREQGMRR
ncbi:HNH endonuclease [Sinorhizobium meliloti]|nr:HNH endonuclease [Sinorhizobium meliloti]MDW9732621.1 HNH endonuclease [Sinorhizobium meliloti]